MNRFQDYLPALEIALKKLDFWRESYGKSDIDKNHARHYSGERVKETLLKLEQRLEGNYPFHHPQYAGQMLKPPHPAAWLAYTLAMTINPNNHALDGGPPTSKMEKEVVGKLAEMIGYKNNYLGHLTSGGTIANLEALFVAREIHPGRAIAASANAHYTHRRMCRVLNCDFIEIPVDSNGIPDVTFIENNAGQIGTVVVTLGTTGLGYVEPLSDVLKAAWKHDIRVHADAAYGGFFTLIRNQLPSQKHWEALRQTDSIVIDPHKHGLQPYGCGSVLYKDAGVGKYFKHDSPYTYFTSDDLHLGEISLECSRAGAAAAALWTTLEILPLNDTGLGSILTSTRNAALLFSESVKNNDTWQLYTEPDLDIVGYFKLPDDNSISSLNNLNREIFKSGMTDKSNGYHLSLFKVSSTEFTKKFPKFTADSEHAVLLRSVFYERRARTIC